MRMRIAILVLLGVLGFAPFGVLAQEPEETPQTLSPELYPPDEFFLGRVESTETLQREFDGAMRPYQLSRVRIVRGAEKDKVVEIEHAGEVFPLKKGDKIVVAKVTTAGEVAYYIADDYRLPALAVIFAAFFALAGVFGRRKGIMSILGLAFSVFVLAKFIVPRILAGADPLITTLLGSAAILLVSLTLAHGINRRTQVALVSTGLTLGMAALLAVAFVSFAKLFGLGSDEAAYLQFGQFDLIRLRGLLLGGIIIGTLGVLDDVTTAQTAAIDEIAKADPKLGTRELYARGISVGHEHIASLVNTLALAYAGASLPLFILFTISRTQPLWVLINGETIAEEAVRTLVGSTALILAVPISTLLAAYAFSRKPKRLP